MYLISGKVFSKNPSKRGETVTLTLWDKESEESFQPFKTIMLNAPVLVQPNDAKPFFLFIDASQHAVGEG